MSARLASSYIESLTGRRLPHVEYGCEHIQQLFEKNRAKTIKEYRFCVRFIFNPADPLAKQEYCDADGNVAYSIGTLFHCLQCNGNFTEAQRPTHFDAKGHFLCASSEGLEPASAASRNRR